MSAWLEKEAARLFGDDVLTDIPAAEFRPAVQGALNAAQDKAIHFVRMHERFGFPEHARLARAWNDWTILDRHYLARMGG